MRGTDDRQSEMKNFGTHVLPEIEPPPPPKKTAMKHGHLASWTAPWSPYVPHSGHYMYHQV